MSAIQFAAVGLAAGAAVGASARVAMDPQERVSDRIGGGVLAITLGTVLASVPVVMATDTLKWANPGSRSPVAAIGAALAFGVPLATSAVLGWQYVKPPGQ